MVREDYDYIIIGAGIYGLFSAWHISQKYPSRKVLVLEADSSAFQRATFINQARVHNGYHYPRSISTAYKSIKYFNRFVEDFGFCINSSFEQIYAISSSHSWTNADQFEQFCENAKIPCKKIPSSDYFDSDLIDGAYLTEEYSYDAIKLRDFFLEELAKNNNIRILYNSSVTNISLDETAGEYSLLTINSERFYSQFVINASYASTNIISKMTNHPGFRLKYELCEIILCDVKNGALKNVGLTVMDGPFFSIMPFGLSGWHSLTSVTFTPHMTSYETVPEFACQTVQGADCKDMILGNCNSCVAKPQSAWPYMNGLAKKYIRGDIRFDYKESLFSMKPILSTTELDDARPTVVRVHSNNPTFISVLSGKINTIYDLEDYL